MEALLVTGDIFDERSHKSIREFIGNTLTSERNRSTLSVSTRKSRYNIQQGDYILKDKAGKITVISEYEFEFNYEKV